jgi:hypothetical protein
MMWGLCCHSKVYLLLVMCLRQVWNLHLWYCLLANLIFLIKAYLPHCDTHVVIGAIVTSDLIVFQLFLSETLACFSQLSSLFTWYSLGPVHSWWCLDLMSATLSCLSAHTALWFLCCNYIFTWFYPLLEWSWVSIAKSTNPWTALVAGHVIFRPH